ncbi:MAG: hypothetical protein ACJAV5_001057 [Vicingaceae bacterium]|jgi:hypothetical protein
MVTAPYLFKSARLGFRTWEETDIKDVIVMNADPVVCAISQLH